LSFNGSRCRQVPAKRTLDMDRVKACPPGDEQVDLLHGWFSLAPYEVNCDLGPKQRPFGGHSLHLTEADSIGFTVILGRSGTWPFRLK